MKVPGWKKLYKNFFFQNPTRMLYLKHFIPEYWAYLEKV